LVTFNDSVAERVPLTGNVEAVAAALDHFDADGETALIDATLASILIGEIAGPETSRLPFSRSSASSGSDR
jgi:hypothetical protein